LNHEQPKTYTQNNTANAVSSHRPPKASKRDSNKPRKAQSNTSESDSNSGSSSPSKKKQKKQKKKKKKKKLQREWKQEAHGMGRKGSHHQRTRHLPSESDPSSSKESGDILPLDSSASHRSRKN
jgi:hypothetical protein